MKFLVLAAEAPAGDVSLGSGMLGMVLPLGLMLAMIYFLFMRPESKRKKQAAEMLANLQIADEVVTSGGIIGRVIDAKPESDTIVIETGGDKTRIRVLKSCVIENRTIHE
ncbi:MAG: preprotein translocase subunit YajC [Oscillospiraceae bacterium]|nr:preprotein translocase subunit YajC [Oscillospiraceae bacterium]